MKNKKKSSRPFFADTDVQASPQTGSNDAEAPRQRIIPWKMFVGSMVPNWLQCRREIRPGAKLCYGRLCQYAGKNGLCFPKQETLAVELGVGKRQIGSYIAVLKKFRLIEVVRPDRSNMTDYFFLHHPWIDEWEVRQEASAGGMLPAASPEQQNSSSPVGQFPSVPIIKENQGEKNQREENPKNPLVGRKSSSKNHYRSTETGLVGTPEDKQVIEYANSWEGESFTSTPKIDSQWVLAWLARMRARSGPNPWPADWRRALVASWRSEQDGWFARKANAPGGNEGTRKPSVWEMTKQLEALKQRVAEHPANDRSASYISDSVTPDEEAELARLHKEMGRLIVALSESGGVNNESAE